MRGRALFFGLILGALFRDAPATAAPELIGAERCGTCHEKEYKDWQRSGHALAFARLSKVQQRDATCRSCHTMDPSSDEPQLTGVQCESCHGAGRMYAPRHVMKDKELAKLLGLSPVTEETCTPCHSKDTPSVRAWSFAEKVELVKHKDAGAPQAPQAPKQAPARGSP
jgi:hypothetical protein